jgi:hypothetical protein
MGSRSGSKGGTGRGLRDERQTRGFFVPVLARVEGYPNCKGGQKCERGGDGGGTYVGPSVRVWFEYPKVLVEIFVAWMHFCDVIVLVNTMSMTFPEQATIATVCTPVVLEGWKKHRE